MQHRVPTSIRRCLRGLGILPLRIKSFAGCFSGSPAPTFGQDFLFLFPSEVLNLFCKYFVLIASDTEILRRPSSKNYIFGNIACPPASALWSYLLFFSALLLRFIYVSIPFTVFALILRPPPFRTSYQPLGHIASTAAPPFNVTFPLIAGRVQLYPLVEARRICSNTS